MRSFIELPKVQAGDQVAVVSPSAGLPGKYPHVQEQGLRRLREVFGLRPVEYPTTRQMRSSPQDRARDLMAAFADPDNRAVFASIGGDDQINVLAHLNEEIFIRNPKPFFGYSDNTHFETYLWKLGIPSYYGCAIMTQLAMQHRMHDMTTRYLRLALFNKAEAELEASPEFTDVELPWSDPDNLAQPRTMERNEGWYWNGTRDVGGVLWGGCLESLDEQLQVGKYLPTPRMLDGVILFIETSEMLPDAAFVRRVLTAMGERELLAGAQALLVGRPKAWEFDQPHLPEQRRRYRAEQRDVVLEVFRTYNPSGPVVQNLDFGHTDPQIPLPNGGKTQVLSNERKIVVEF